MKKIVIFVCFALIISGCGVKEIKKEPIERIIAPKAVERPKLMEAKKEMADSTVWKTTGVQKAWHTLTFRFTGPSTMDQAGNDPNPFLDYRLTLIMKSPAGRYIDVPGYFAGDGNGGGSGNVWYAKFTPDEEGVWSYTVNFKSGSRIAIDPNLDMGTSVVPNGSIGAFNIQSRDANALGFTSKGKLCNASCFAYDSSDLGGDVFSDQEWDADNSPYTITKTILIKPGATINVKPGSVIKFNPGTSIKSDGGTLRAVGTAVPIVFKPSDDKVTSVITKETSVDPKTKIITQTFKNVNVPKTASKSKTVKASLSGTNFYLKTVGDCKYWVKGGSDCPENFLAYSGFVNTTANPAEPTWLHHYSPHVKHWKSGDPDWDNGKGKGIIGALNYLASKKVNSIYPLLCNIGGDGKDVWPFYGNINRAGSASNDNLHYDILKLYQWDIVFAHAQGLGIALHFVLNEGEKENKNELDNATLGVERKLFYREMIARFGYHNAVIWNLCEEYDHHESGATLSPDMIRSWAQYVRNTDPYDHPITVHNWSSTAFYTNYDGCDPFFGDSRFDLVSFQYRPTLPAHQSYGKKTEVLRQRSADAGRKIMIGMDETSTAFAYEGECEKVLDWLVNCGYDGFRKTVIYPVYFSGGNLEAILGTTLFTQDFALYEKTWNQMWYARDFIESLPFWDMEPKDSLLIDYAGEVFTDYNNYAIYLPTGGNRSINLANTQGTLLKRWYNPRTGLFEGGDSTIQGGGIKSLGNPPHSVNEDWAVLLKKM